MASAEAALSWVLALGAESDTEALVAEEGFSLAGEMLAALAEAAEEGLSILKLEELAA